MAYPSGQIIPDAVYQWILFGGLAALFYLLATRKQRKRLMITDFRRGVHFVGGTMKDVLGPGSYIYNVRKEEITVVDMRPHPILIERIAFQDALGHGGIVSIGASLVVRDPTLAATVLRDQVSDSYLIVRDTLKATLSTQIAPSKENAELMQRAVEVAVNAELGKAGMGVSDLEVTELWSGVPRLQTNSGTGILQ